MYRRDWRVATECDHRTSVEQCPGRVGPRQTLVIKPFPCPAAVINDVKRLHRGNDLLAAKTFYVLLTQVLCVLYAKTAVTPAVHLGDLLVDIKHLVIGPVTDRMYRSLQSGLVCTGYAFAEHRHLYDAKARVLRVVQIWLEQPGGP